MDDSAVYETLTQCYLLLRSKCPTDEQIQKATKWLDSFYKQAIAIQHLINFYKQSSDPTDRQHAIIGLNKCVGLAWESVAVESRAEVFQILLSMITTEPEWTIRRNIIDILSKAISPDYCSIIMDFIKFCISKENTAYLEIALLLSALFPQGFIESINDQSVTNFFYEMVEVAFQSQQPEVLIAAVQFLLENNVIDCSAETNSSFWEACVNCFDLVIGNNLLFSRLVTLYASALGHSPVVGNPIPLLEKCIDQFTKSKEDSKLVLQLNLIIQAICHNYAQIVIESENAAPIIEMYMTYIMEIFEPDDQFILSNAPLLEQIFTDLCTADTIQPMWDMCMQVSSEPAGLFAFSRMMSATYTVAIDFYSQKLEEVISILRAGILSDSNLLRDSCARSADDFVSTFVFESDELSFAFINDVANTCQENISGELLTVLASLLDATKKTDRVFDVFFPFLVSVVQECDVETQSAALQSISNLAKWSSLKIFVYYPQLLNILFDIINSASDALEHLKGPAVATIAIVAVAIGPTFDEYVPTTFTFLIENLNNEELSASCITALEKIITMYIELPDGSTKSIEPYISRLLPFVLENAELDYSPFYKEENNDEGYELPPQFEKSASSLKLLSDIIVISNDYFDQFHEELIKCCQLQSTSIAPSCRIAAAASLVNLARKTPVNTDTEKEIAQNIGEIIVKLASECDANVCYQSFLSAEQIITYIDYTGLIEHIEKLIDVVCQMINDPQTQLKRPTERGRDLFNAACDFLMMLSYAAGERMLELIAPLIPSLVTFSTSNVIRFRSIALSILSSLLNYSSCKVEDDLKNKALEASLTTVEGDQTDDGSAFLCLRALATVDRDLVRPYSEKLIQIFLNHLDPNKVNLVERSILMRDRCVTCLGKFVMDIMSPDEYDLSQVIPLALSAMPIQLDFELESDCFSFFLWLFQRAEGNFNDLFLRVLAVEFSHHPSIIELHKLGKSEIRELLSLAMEIIENTPDSDKLVIAAVEGDETRIDFFRANLQSVQLAMEEEMAEAEEEPNE
ncbi:hypothetical protein TVAG_056330 [Trichomonas vaginalis G3]|uniref:Importin subunit beta-1/Transportin-1-like TPR repeats domain-containing protein n=1 Tax=Trichomonas vaginalis (strain ATCC PRA-98 / G3) TaxID=412133 RepID=A2ECJ2_TRIV3|nr:armadillo (ARM) repeat-containing protein family [Trichomonas vaginalis G3]EAY09589.1 hypothetical protein TVAG_056330 [Trichomonas vaginalis G3]KAI5502100.1 armadillo (ARM) repeat-containing protein family [Trichomonas vaginalis G3]|eukprot:XP_001321812.1 hypothetical protein [Trichomonas vaginalis G3]